ncbi:MAG: SH3 domain-containing protein [Pseudomonadota bacterium]
MLSIKIKVIKNYTSAYPNPIKVKLNEMVEIKEKETDWEGWLWCKNKNDIEGWVPEKIIKREGNIGKVLRDYEATELTVAAGEELMFLEEESGWLFCKNSQNQKGWVPAENTDY